MQTRKKFKYEMKPAFEERMKTLLPNPEDFTAFEKIIHTQPESFIRCNTLKISPSELLSRLSKKWKVAQPFSTHPEIMLIETDLGPGELGNSVEHLMGLYYVQELSSMLPPLALNPQPGELVLDLTASPGSKTTQMASLMKNQGTLFANDLKIGRIRILTANLERCGVTNCIVTRGDAISICLRLKKLNYKFDKILLDAPCSGEGTMRSSPKTFLMWNQKVIKSLSRMQKKLLANALSILKVGGEIVYSTCTHAPEENEAVVDFALENFPVEVVSIKSSLPIKTRPGLQSWDSEIFSKEVCHTCRVYPQDNNTEGFFVSKLTLLNEIPKREVKE